MGHGRTQFGAGLAQPVTGAKSVSFLALTHCGPFDKLLGFWEPVSSSVKWGDLCLPPGLWELSEVIMEVKD